MTAVHALPVPDDVDGPAPPADIDAERALIGAALDNQTVVDAVTETGLTPGDLYRPAHRALWQLIVELADAGTPLTPVTVASAVRDRGAEELGAAVDPTYVAECYTSAAPGTATAVHHAHTILGHARRRALIAAGTRITQLGWDRSGDPDELEQRAEHALDLATRPRGTGDLPSMADLVPGWLDRLEQPDPDEAGLVRPPYRDLAEVIPVWRPGQLIVVAARPAVGKSTIALDIARAAAIGQGAPTLFASLEMSTDEIMTRLYAAEARISQRALQERTLTDDDWRRIAQVTDRIASAPLRLDAATDYPLARLSARLRHMDRTGTPAQLVIVDYLGLMRGPRALESRYQEVSEITRALKSVAMEWQVPVIALAQLNRESTKRNDKTPQISDLRDSGSIEQDADIVILLHREDAYDKESPRAGEMDLIVAKHRNGPTATVTVAFQGHYGRCRDLSAGLPY